VIRPTIGGIAERAGVSKSAVSYALNGKEGVSEATRARILSIAAECGWQPSTAARALAGTGIGSVGLVLNRNARILSFEPFYMELISGIEEVLGPMDIALVLQVVGSKEDEAATYRRWSASRKVDAVLLTDLEVSDSRPQLLRDIDLRFVVVGPEGDHGAVAVSSDDAGAMRQAVRYLAALGHRVIAHVGGTAAYLHSQTRARALAEEARVLGLAEPQTLATDFSSEQGMMATRRLLSNVPRPTAIIYDNDVMAAVGLAVAREMGVAVPGDVSFVAWDDSILSRMMYPPLTSISTDVRGYGMQVARAVLAVLRGEDAGLASVPSSGLVVRGTTAAVRPAPNTEPA
jgi:DNA-binding LacI/PurR family transcriptional regulator